MQNIPSDLNITVKNYIDITSYKMKGTPDLSQADVCLELGTVGMSCECHIYAYRWRHTFLKIRFCGKCNLQEGYGLCLGYLMFLDDLRYAVQNALLVVSLPLK